MVNHKCLVVKCDHNCLTKANRIWRVFASRGDEQYYLEGVCRFNGSPAKGWVMVNLARASESTPPIPPVGRGARWDVWVRLCAAVGVACVFLLVSYPWGDLYYPEGNWLRGPLWLFKTQVSADKMIGAVVTAFLLPTLFAWVVKRSLFTKVAVAVGAVAWVCFGIWLAAIAIV